MVELIKWILGSFWHFVGACILIGVMFKGLALLIHGWPPSEDE